MTISNIRIVEARRNGDDVKFVTLETPEEEDLAANFTLSLTFHHDAGGEDTVLISDEESRILFEALDDWIYGG